MDPSLPIAWSDWPAPRSPTRATLAGIVIGGAGVAASAMEPLAGVVCAGLLLSATGEVMLPTSYALDTDGITVRRLLEHRRVGWDELISWQAAPEGFVLIGRGRTRWRRDRRTVRLRCPGREETVRAMLIARLGPEGRNT